MVGFATLVALPLLASAQELNRITPEQPDTSILTTKKDAGGEDIKQPEMPAGVSPFQHVEQGGNKLPSTPPTAPETAKQPANFQQKMPFGRGEAATMQNIPSGPHQSAAVPVVNVDSVEASEPAPPTPVEPEAVPNEENAADPTELTSPIFGAEENALAPRKILLRAQNKVTAQSAVIALKPGEKVSFGQLEISAVTCQVSAPTSQTDYAGLIDIAERQPGSAELKPLFKGWMYASSPSITGLEHPVYDITMVECRLMPAAPKPEEKSEKTEKKSEKTDKKSDKKPEKPKAKAGKH